MWCKKLTPFIEHAVVVIFGSTRDWMISVNSSSGLGSFRDQMPNACVICSVSTCFFQYLTRLRQDRRSIQNWTAKLLTFWITVAWLDVNTQHREHREKHVMWMSSMSSVQLWGKATRKVRHSTLLQHCQSSAWPFRLESGAWLAPSMKPRQSWRANPWNGRQLAGDSTRIESIVQKEVPKETK